MQFVKVMNRTRGTVIGESVEVANTSLTRLWGLLGRSGLKTGGGLWIKPSSGVHTMGMKFVIDVIGLDHQMRVVKIWPALRPYRLTSVNLKVASVLELSAGTAEVYSIQIGDIIEVLRRPG